MQLRLLLLLLLLLLVAGVFNLLTPPANSAGGQPVSGTS